VPGAPSIASGCQRALVLLYAHTTNVSSIITYYLLLLLLLLLLLHKMWSVMLCAQGTPPAKQKQEGQFLAILANGRSCKCRINFGLIGPANVEAMSEGVEYWDNDGASFPKGLKNGVPNICIELPDTLCESCKTMLSSKGFASHLVHQATLWQVERVDKAKQQPLKNNESKKALRFWQKGRVVVVPMTRSTKLKCLLMHFDFEVKPSYLKKWLMQVAASTTASGSVCDCLQLMKYAHKSWTDKDKVNEWEKAQDFFATKHNVVSCSYYTFNDTTPRAMTQSVVVHDTETIDRSAALYNDGVCFVFARQHCNATLLPFLCAFANRFYDAFSSCDVAAVSGLAQEVPQLLKTKAGKCNCGPMAVAAKVVAAVPQKRQLLQTLLHCGADINERSSKSNTTALNHLAHRGNVECVQVMLHEGADGCIGSNATPPWPPVHTAVKQEYPEVVELLVQLQLCN
jgi:Ankyrin repeats (3 copies)